MFNYSCRVWLLVRDLSINSNDSWSRDCHVIGTWLTFLISSRLYCTYGTYHMSSSFPPMYYTMLSSLKDRTEFDLSSHILIQLFENLKVLCRSSSQTLTHERTRIRAHGVTGIRSLLPVHEPTFSPVPFSSSAFAPGSKKRWRLQRLQYAPL